MTVETPPRLALLDLVKTYTSHSGDAAAVRGVSLDIGGGEIFGVIGESGAGKSTLIRLMNLLERPTSGRVLLDGEDLATLTPEALRRRRRRIGMIFQHFNLLSSKTVAENVALPLRLEGRVSAADRQARTAALLDRVGLTGLGEKYPSQLSGGQKQRVAIARALACDPTVLLCDEATSALDPETTEQILSLLAALNRDLGLTIVVITHEMDVVRQICDRVAVMAAGQVAEVGDVIDVFLNAESAATRRLLREDDTVPLASGADRTFRLTYRGSIAAEPFLSRVAQSTGVDFSLHRARAGEIKGEPYGQLVLSLGGPRLEEALACFETAGVRVQELTR